MIIAITAGGKTLESAFDTRFGRAAGFILFDTDTATATFCDNTQNLEAAQGAGIQAAQTVANAGARVLITGHCGPKAFTVLQAAGIKIYQTKAETAGYALHLYQSGALPEVTAPDVEGHWA